MLADLVAIDVFQFLLTFVRLGAALMLMPGFGGAMVTQRIRLLLALTLTLVVVPVVAPLLPPMPASPADLVVLLVGEATVGFFLGMVAQMLMVALGLAGTMMGFQAGMANAFTLDPVAEQQSSILPGFLASVALVLIFASDMHHLMLRAIVNSYGLFLPGQPLPLGDMANSLAETLARSFRLGVQLAGPIVVFGLIFNAGLGLMTRLMPQMQIYFVAMPLQVFVGVLLVAATLPAIMILFLRALEDGLLALAGGG